ncbi:hypothetical protein HK101_000337 [Irineochytrium annulatum]|nr:hypothetical protein HK101_000337 [Irineochytrium annulatum]
MGSGRLPDELWIGALSYLDPLTLWSFVRPCSRDLHRLAAVQLHNLLAANALIPLPSRPDFLAGEREATYLARNLVHLANDRGMAPEHLGLLLATATPRPRPYSLPDIVAELAWCRKRKPRLVRVLRGLSLAFHRAMDPEHAALELGRAVALIKGHTIARNPIFGSLGEMPDAGLLKEMGRVGHAVAGMAYWSGDAGGYERRCREVIADLATDGKIRETQAVLQAALMARASCERRAVELSQPFLDQGG